jgi:hypothetical protein
LFACGSTINPGDTMALFATKSELVELNDLIAHVSTELVDYFPRFEDDLLAFGASDSLTPEIIEEAKNNVMSYLVAVYKVLVTFATTDGKLLGLKDYSERKLDGIIDVMFVDALKMKLVIMGMNKKQASKGSKTFVYRAGMYINQATKLVGVNSSRDDLLLFVCKQYQLSVVNVEKVSDSPAATTVIGVAHGIYSEIETSFDAMFS